MYDNLIDAITHMDGNDAKRVLVCLMQTIDDELCKNFKHTNDIDVRDSVIFNDALCWVKDCVQLTVDFGLRLRMKDENT